MQIKKLYQKYPCKKCPFRKVGGLQVDGIEYYLNETSFICHQTIKGQRKQCAGHMLIKGSENAFVSKAYSMGLKLSLRGKEYVFNNKKGCIKHHKNSCSNEC